MTEVGNELKAEAGNLYQYQTLKHSDSFRLVELLPGDPSLPINCRLIEARRSDNADFEALSYTWGSMDRTRQIHESTTNATIAITENLSDALSALRHRYSIRTIFIDAICINQASIAERNHQVAQMGNIYRGAKLVIGWLGKAPASQAIQQLEYMGRNSARCGIRAAAPVIMNQVLNLSEREALEELSSKLNLAELGLIFDRPWFERVWIIQEFVLAQDVIFHANDRSLTYDLFSKGMAVLGLIIRWMTLSGLGDPEQLKELHTFANYSRITGLIQMRERHLFSQRRKFAGGPAPMDQYAVGPLEIPLAGYCVSVTNYKCIDARDRVYGMLGLAQGELQIRPDYNDHNTPQKAFTNLALQSLAAGDLTILHHAGIPWVEGSVQLPKLPSFVADLEALHDVTPHIGVFANPRFSAGSRNPAEVYFVSCGDTILPRLRTRIISSIDRIISVSREDSFIAEHFDVSGLPPQFAISVSALHDAYDLFRALASQGESFNAQSFDIAFALTILAGNNILEVHFLQPDGIGIHLLLNLMFVYFYSHNKTRIPEDIYFLQNNLTKTFWDESDSFIPSTMYANEQAAQLSRSISPPDPSRQYTDREIMSRLETKLPLDHFLQAYHNVVRSILGRRSIYRTTKGQVGLGRHSMLPGDIVAVLDGAETPFILRPVGSIDTSSLVTATGQARGNGDSLPEATRNRMELSYRVVGECYLHGWMNGEALSDESGISHEYIVLV